MSHSDNEEPLAVQAGVDESEGEVIDLGSEDGLSSDSSLSSEPPCALLTGEAGTGKTFTIKSRLEADPLYGVLCASTGIAAVNLGGTTINSLLGFYDTASLKDSFQRGRLHTKLHKIAAKGYKNIIVDEGSMVVKEQLDIIHRALTEVNSYKSMHARPPLGLIVIADFCFGLGTPIMMADGTIKKVEEIEVGDRVMGVDSQPRNVLKITSGIDQLFLVAQTNGDDYVVNSQHLLTLIRGRDGNRLDKGTYLRYPTLGQHLTITAPELANRSQKFRECFVGHKAGVVKLPVRPISIDPYFLGLWLGDGSSSDNKITTADTEVLVYCDAYAAQLGLKSVPRLYPNTTAVDIRLSHGRGNRPNFLRSSLREYGLFGNKHIPDDYQLNSEENRLRLLAGLLDSDGSWAGNRFRITLTIERLARQIKQLADQLGFRTGFRSLTNGWYKDGANGGAWTVTIGGDTWRIPTKVLRKQSKPRDLVRNRLTSVLDIIPQGIGEYVGFEIDGDNLFLLGDGTVAHNCQLPPIVEKSERVRGSKINPKWLFKADVWEKAFAPNIVRLTKVWRQSHPEFLQVINHLRRGQGQAAVDLLEPLTKFEWSLDQQFDGTTIVATNDEVDRHNFIRLQNLSEKVIEVDSARWGKQSGEWTKNIPQKLQVKLGAYVMILNNDSPTFSFVNGDTGHIVDFDGKSFGVELIRTGQVVRIHKIHRTITTYDDPDPATTEAGGWPEATWDYVPFGQVSYNVDKEIWHVGGVRYFPLRLGWASSVHKSQGLSLDRCQIDFRHPFFSSPSMLYVACSRVRTPEGLRLIGKPNEFVKRCNIDPEIIPWL